MQKGGRIHAVNQACIPVLGTKYSAGIDVKANILKCTNNQRDFICIERGEKKLVPTGIYFDVFDSSNIQLQVFSKSGLAVYESIWAGNGQNKDEFYIEMINGGNEDVTIEHGQPIAQVIVTDMSNIQQKSYHEKDFLYTTTEAIIEPYTQELVNVKFSHHLLDQEYGIITANPLINHNNLHIFPGIIDSDYTGKLSVFCMNENDHPIHFEKNSPIALLSRYKTVNYRHFFEIIYEFNNSVSSEHNDLVKSNKIHSLEIVRNFRGTGGFGSTSVKHQFNTRNKSFDKNKYCLPFSKLYETLYNITCT